LYLIRDVVYIGTEELPNCLTYYK